MKRKKKQQLHPSTLMDLDAARALAGENWHEKWWFGPKKAWLHSYMDRLAWKMYNDVMEFAYCYARFDILLTKRKEALLAHPEEIARYYMARAQVRFARELARKRKEEER